MFPVSAYRKARLTFTWNWSVPILSVAYRHVQQTLGGLRR